MKLKLVWILFIYSVNAKSTDYIDKNVEILDCSSTQSISGETEITQDLHCSANTVKNFKLKEKSKILFSSITFTSKESNVNTKLCKKMSNDEYQIYMDGDVQSIVYSKDGNGKAILVGANADACATSVLASDTILATGKLVVKSISCIKKEQLPKIQIATATPGTTKKEYHVLGNHICFLAPMLQTPFKTKVKVNNKEIDLTISSYPIEDCPICPTSKPETNTTQTVAASSTGMIAGIVVAVLIVVLGGIGFVMMKK